MSDETMTSNSSDSTTASNSLVRGRPRSTSISSGSPNPAPGVPLPSLFPDPIPAPPQLSHSSNNNFPFSFPSNSTTASSSLSSNFGPPWGKISNSTGLGNGGGGGGHRSSLSVPGIISPSPLSPGAVPRGGRHRRTQSVSPPGFSMSEDGGKGEDAQAVESRRSSEPSLPVSKAEGSLGIPISSSPRQPRLNISTSIGTRLSHQRSPSSPTRSPRAKPLSSVPTSTMSISPTNQSLFEHQQLQSHSHLVHHSHHPQHPHHIPISSHAALLQGVRSHALPHSPTLDAIPGHHHDVSPLSTSPSIPHHAGFAARRLSGGQSSSTRPSFSTTLSLSSPTYSSGSDSIASPPFGPTSPSTNGRISPLPFDISRPHSTTAARDDKLRHLALDQAMTDAILDHESTSPPPVHSFHSRRRSSSGASNSPPLLPLPFDLGTPASPRGGTRPRSGSVGRAVSSSTSPASLFLDEDQGDSSPNEMKDGSPCEVHREEIDIARPPSPPMVTDSLFPVSGTLPPPSPPATTLSSLGFNIPSPITSDTPTPASPSFSSSPVLSGLSSSRPSPPSVSTSTSSPLPDADSLPPASPHRGPISLPPPLNAPTPLPPHLIGGSAARSRSRSRSREREKERKLEKSRSRSRSGSREREMKGDGEAKERAQSPAGMRLTGLEFVPKVHSPLASPPATEPRESSKMIQVEEEKEQNAIEEEGTETSTLESSTENAETDSTRTTSSLPPPIPPASIDRTISSALGLPHLAIPSATSPVGTPEHLEESPTSSESYFALAPGAALSRSPPPLPDHLATLPALPSLERPPSWEDELDDDDFDDIDHDGSGELGYSAGAGRKSSGTKAEEERVSLLQALGISKTDAEREKEREMAQQEAERRRVEQESQEREREERAREDERERQREFSALGFMDVDLEAQEKALEQDHGDVGNAGEAGDLSVGDVEAEALQIDEESLSALERIFVCAKSEAVEERARVAHFLADWVPAVEICEAVEYVLPLLAGLIEDEMVKEVFAPQLDRVMWYFFSHCPLAELDSNSEKASSCSGSPVPSRYKSRSNSLVVDISPDPSVCGPSDRSATPPPTSETSPTQSHADTSSPNLPRISVTTFTALLGALLTDQSTTVAKATEAAVVRFLCRLKDKPIPLDSPSECSLEFTPSSQSQPLPELSISEPDPHSSYTFTTEARQVLEDEVVSGIVIGLARLDEDDHEAEQASAPAPQRPEVDKGRANEIKEDEIEDPVLFMSPEEHSLDDVEEGSDEDMKFFEDWRTDREQSNLESSSAALNMPISRSPPHQVLSSFSPEQPADEEASIGKMVSMSLMGAIAAADCLDSSVLIKQFLPEVQRMKAEGMFYVRKEAVQALGNLATVVPASELESTLLPLHAFFSQDQVWHVRRAAVLALPSVCKPLSSTSLRTKAIEAIRQFSADDNRNVRSGALEIAGELIFLFHEDPQGVPDELLSFFLGTSLDSNKPSAPPSNPFSHFRSALESPPNSFLGTSNSWQSPGFFGRDTRDADRPILTAFNFPAVVLTLGRDKWDLVKDHHLSLCKDPVEKARQSLASSLHEVAKIIGNNQADACLLEPLSWFLQDAENVQTAILENVSTLLLSFGGDAAKKALILFGDSWIDIVNWRLREQALKKIADFGPHFMQNDGEEQVLSVLAKAFKDSVASVREQATVTIPPLLNAVLDRPSSLSKLLAFLNVYRTDSSYRNRVAYVSSVVACVRASLPRDIFEFHFLESLVELARDKVVSVRIAVSRAINEACQCVALYSDPSTRSALREVLSILAASPDRDVRLPILDFYERSPSASREPSPPSNQASPEATRPNHYTYGVNLEESPRAEIIEEDSPMNESSTEQDDSDMSEFEPSSSNFDTDGVLLERPSDGEDIVTRDGDEEGGFVEVSRP